MKLKDLTYYISSLWDMIGVQVLDSQDNLGTVEGFCAVSEFEEFASNSEISEFNVINIIPGAVYNSIVLIVRGK